MLNAQSSKVKELGGERRFLGREFLRALMEEEEAGRG
jgi:hypothetical protein